MGRPYAHVYKGTPETYLDHLKTLRPGDVLELGPGHYTRGLSLSGLHGEPGREIIIRGVAGRDVTLSAASARDGVRIRESSHIVLRDFQIDGRGRLANGVKCVGRDSHHITLENLYIHDLAPHQQMVGISTKCPAWDWVIRSNTIAGAGTGMYLGDSDGSDPFIGGLIEGNLVMDTIGYNLQIKHQKPRPELPGVSPSRRQTTIRCNVFIKSRGNSTGEHARPNVLVGHFPLKGAGQDDIYLIYSNLFFQNPGEALFQGEGNIALYNNLFFNSHDNAFPAVAIQPHNDIPRKIRIFFNTVIDPWKGIRVLHKEEGRIGDEKIMGNAVFSEIPLQGGQHAHNVTADYDSVGRHLRNPVDDLDELDLFPKGSSLRGRPLDMEKFSGFPGARCDFNGTAREGIYRGAYVGEGMNPGWKPRYAHRHLVRCNAGQGGAK